MRHRVLLLGIAVAAVLLVPWSVYLACTLPDRFVTGQWRAAWVGFDAALVVSLAGGALLGLRRRRSAVPLLAASAALLFCDAWFDVSLDWGSADAATSVLLAVLVEVPSGILLLAWGRRLISDDVRTDRLMRRHLRLRGDPWFQRAAQALDRLGPADLRTIATAAGAGETATAARLREAAGLGRTVAPAAGAGETAIAARLREAAALGLVRRQHDGRWVLAGHPDARLRDERELLGWAAEHRGEFGAWGYGQRVVAHLSGAEIARFAGEYRELVSRYRLLHPGPAAGTREVGIRCYAFPMPPAPADDDSDAAAVRGGRPAP